MSLYLKYRPKDWPEVIGQATAVSKLKDRIDKKKMPKVVLLYGDTGTGKTTIARILARKLGVDPDDNNGMNYIEMNCADCRSIDDIRDIIDQMRLSAWGGGNRIWVLDEVVQLPTATQQAMLKMLEDTPKHVYFFLLTSDKSKLLDTIVGRCFPVFLHAFKPETIEAMVKSIAAKEGNKDLSKRVASKIAIQADGSARMALQLLESCLTQPTEKQQLDSIEEAVEETVAFDLAKAVMYKKEWKIVSSILQRLKDNPETARRVALKYAETVLLGDSDIKQKLKASALINVFRYDLSESGRPGLTDICWRVCCGKSQ